jgi:ketosteroid isomerase-like protein
MNLDPLDAVRAYYGALDAGAYDRLADLLAPGFVQRRPDRTFEGRAAFVRFMRDERPRTDTTHAVDALYRRADDRDGDADAITDPGAGAEVAEVAARGRLLAADGTELVGFVDAFAVADGTLRSLDTYTA